MTIKIEDFKSAYEGMTDDELGNAILDIGNVYRARYDKETDAADDTQMGVMIFLSRHDGEMRDLERLAACNGEVAFHALVSIIDMIPEEVRIPAVTSALTVLADTAGEGGVSL